MPSSSSCECPRHCREVGRRRDHSPVAARGQNVSPAFWDDRQETIGMSERNYLFALAIDDERRRRDLADIVLVPGQPAGRLDPLHRRRVRSEEHTSELQSLMRISYAVFCLKKKKHTKYNKTTKLTTSHTKHNTSVLT